MKTADKVLLITVALINYAVAALIILSRFVGIFRPFDGIIAFHLGNGKLETAVLVFAVILILAVGTSFFVIVADSSKYRLIDRKDTLVINDDVQGKSEITFDAVRAIASRKCRTFRFVQEVKCDLYMKKDEPVLDIRLRPVQDTVLTEATVQMREAVVQAIAEQTGITIGRVRILILPYRQK